MLHASECTVEYKQTFNENKTFTFSHKFFIKLSLKIISHNWLLIMHSLYRKDCEKFKEFSKNSKSL